jgi:hypothetical protein
MPWVRSGCPALSTLDRRLLLHLPDLWPCLARPQHWVCCWISPPRPMHRQRRHRRRLPSWPAPRAVQSPLGGTREHPAAPSKRPSRLCRPTRPDTWRSQLKGTRGGFGQYGYDVIPPIPVGDPSDSATGQKWLFGVGELGGGLQSNLLSQSAWDSQVRRANPILNLHLRTTATTPRWPYHSLHRQPMHPSITLKWMCGVSRYFPGLVPSFY